MLFERASYSPPPIISRRSTPQIVLVVAVLLTLAGGFAAWVASESRHLLQSQKAVLQIQHNLRNQLHTYIAFMRGTSALFAAGDQVTREEFATYVNVLSLKSQFPGVQAIGYSLRVPASERDGFTERLHADGFPQFTIWPEGARGEYHAILYVSSLDYRYRVTVGYDMSTEPLLRAAMERATDTGEPTASAKVPLMPGFVTPEQVGFFIFAPVYQGSGIPATVAQRRELLRGYVYSSIRADELIAAVFASEVDVRVFDGARFDPKALLFDSHMERPEPNRGTLSLDRELTVGGRTWQLVYTAEPDTFERWLAPSVLIGGVVMSLLLYRTTRAQVVARVGAERAAADLRESQAALRASEAEAVAANKAKDAFLATLSHELRTPLNAILGWASILRSTKLDQDRQTRAMEVIDRNARVQARLIEDLFDVSRIVSGKLTIEPRPIDVAPVLGSALEAVRPTAESKGVRISADLDPNIPLLLADPARLQQIVWNLLSNAIKFTPEGGRAELSLRRAGSQAEIRVTDTGVGIPSGFLPHVFERFRQADNTTTREHGGMGLGLAIVQHLVQLHGGAVDAASDGVGRGTTMTVRLPLAPSVRPVIESPVAAAAEAQRVAAVTQVTAVSEASH